MKKALATLCFLLLLIVPLSSFCQSNADTVTHKIAAVHKEKLTGRLYNASTGNPISSEEFSEMIAENPEIKLERIYNNRGVVEKFLYHPESPNFIPDQAANKPQEGEVFPDLIVNSVDEEEVSIAHLKGQWIIIRFGFFTKMMDMNDYGMYLESLENIPSEIAYTAIHFSLDNEQEVIKTLKPLSKKEKLVANCRNFFDMLHIKNMPTTLLVNPQQKVVKYFTRENYSEIPMVITSNGIN
ncbi:peroxiredoxin family protein [Algoriphagus halophytocola]|uniref:Peroxiredoxin family protein n=1 Tax=Algoriphagus halophytocola TaxID=2991499 RepID=A0ABY6MP09_9BACT|nr:peroxiredoxin family protein [Algoriphagus sp. TR-M5]UZD24436.1 peroxiredoxin family protein [Algoriphagus sp. TR-M5]